MAEESVINTPRIDRQFCFPNGMLTQNAYALLYGLIRRTGGVVGSVIDADGMTEQLDALAQAPFPESAPAFQNDPGPPPVSYFFAYEAPDGRLQALEAEVQQLRSLVDGLTQGYQV